MVNWEKVRGWVSAPLMSLGLRGRAPGPGSADARGEEIAGGRWGVARRS